MARALLFSLAFLLAPVAGCLVPDGGGDRTGDLVRIVTLTVDPEAFEDEPNDAADVFASLADTRFEYTHSEDAVPAADVTVEYVDESGLERSRPLSDFTALDQVGRGDKVTIGGALLTSRIELRHAGEVLASRGGASADWLEVGGYPLPFAMRGGLAVWDVTGGIELDAGFDHIQVVQDGQDSTWACEADASGEEDCTGEETQHTSTVRFDDATGEADTDLDGKLRLDSVGSGLEPAVELGLEGTWVLGALFNVHVQESSTAPGSEATDADFGAELQATAIGDGSLRFRFDRDGALQAVGGQGDLDVNGDVIVWDDEHARSEGFSPGDLDDLDVSTPFEESPVYMDDNPVSFIAQALVDLWRMDLAPGDVFSFSSGGMFGGDEDVPSLSITVRVVEQVEKTVPAGTFDALRVETNMVLEVPVPGTFERFEMPTLTTWIDEDSGLPVAVEQRVDYHFDQRDVAPLFDYAQDIDDGLQVTPPEELHFDLEGRTLAELEDWDDGFRMAPMASVLLPLASIAPPFLGLFFGYGFPFGGHGMSEDEPATPDVAFAMDDAQDRLTLIHGEDELYAWDFSIRATDFVGMERNGAATHASMPLGDGDQSMMGEGDDDMELVPGDYYEFCGYDGATGPVTFTVMHGPTNTIVYETTVSQVAAC